MKHVAFPPMALTEVSWENVIAPLKMISGAWAMVLLGLAST